jgi:phospholipid/cholesterol/gamma-HCH transport system permease protein
MTLLDALENLGHVLQFAGRALWAAPFSVLRFRELARQLYNVLLGALPLAGAAGLALGVVIWIHLHGILTEFNPEAVRLLPKFLAVAVVLEFAPIGAGFIVAGRSGASLGAELGSMRLTEQIDALEVLGLSPMYHLVGPRVLACMLALPLLTVFIGFLALAGSYGAEALGGNLHWSEYQHLWLSNLRWHTIIPATLKTVVFGYLIAVTGCYCGMNAPGGTEGVGRAATRGVVGSIFLVLASNVILVKAIQVLN